MFSSLRPRMERLVEASRRLREGDLTARSQFPDYRGKFGEVARAFDEMAASLEQRQLQLAESKNHLEKALIELKSAQDKMLQQERIHALGQMAGGIAHDFNNCLTTILGFTEILLEQKGLLENKEKLASYLKKMNQSAQDGASIVKRLREFYRERDQDEPFVPINLNALVEETKGLTQPRWKDQAMAQGSTICFECRLEEIPPILGNDSELREALTNLIFNAVDAMPKGGTLTVSTRSEGEDVILEVGDTGAGMTEEVRNRCLEPFFSTKGKLGTGLGLSMVYGIAQRHDGHIEITSELGKGSSFILRFPVHTKTAQEKEEQKKKSSQVGPLKILVVEDEEVVREVVLEYLRRDGHQPTGTSNAAQAIQILKNSKFDLIISDGGMPGISGQQLAARVQQMKPNPPLILLTGYADYLMINKKEQKGIDLILPKPVTIKTLREGIAKVVSVKSVA